MDKEKLLEELKRLADSAKVSTDDDVVAAAAVLLTIQSALTAGVVPQLLNHTIIFTNELIEGLKKTSEPLSELQKAQIKHVIQNRLT